MDALLKTVFVGLLLLINTFVAAQEDKGALIIEEYDKLEAMMDTMGEESKKESRYFLALALPFYQLAKSSASYDGLKLPTLLYNTRADFFKSPFGKKEWLNWSNDLLIDLRFGAVNFKVYHGYPFPFSLMMDQQRYATLTECNLIKDPLFDPLLEAIDEFNTQKTSNNAETKGEEVSELLQLYENKYRGGYRNRNVLEYFINGGMQAWEQKRNKTPKGLLSPPSQYEVIFLANPILGIGSPSFKKFSDDPNSVYLIVQLIGIDKHNKDFSKFSGISIFHASPVNTNLQFFTRPLLGLEFHYNQLNIGCGVEYPKFKPNSPDNYAFKVFLSFAAFDIVYKKRKGKNKNDLNF